MLLVGRGMQPQEAGVQRKSLKIGEMLVKAGVIDSFQLNSALSHQRHWGGRLGSSLVKLGYVAEDKLLAFLAEQLNLPRVDLSKRVIPVDLLAYVPADKAREFNVIPVDRKEMSGTLNLLVAMADPANLPVIDALQFMTGCRVFPALAAEESIRKAIEHYYGLPQALQELDAPLGQEPAAAATSVAPLLNGLAARAQAEDKFQQLLRVLLDKGVLSLREYERLK
jgi:Type II secretion system (T2SS), protein E, N-terminal domain